MFFYGKTAANAIAVMSYLATAPAKKGGSQEVAEARGLSQALAAKLLSQMATAGILKGFPGPGGGYTLAKPAESITLFDIVSIFENTTGNSVCPFGGEWCGTGTPCPLHDNIFAIQESNMNFLKNNTLAVFIENTETTPESGANGCDLYKKENTPLP